MLLFLEQNATVKISGRLCVYPGNDNDNVVYMVVSINLFSIQTVAVRATARQQLPPRGPTMYVYNDV